MKARLSKPRSSRSVFARRCSRETGMLVGWMTYASMPRARSQRANQKPSRPASKATAMQQTQQCLFVRADFLLRMPVDPWDDTADQPSFLAQLHHHSDGGIAFEGDEGSAEVV